MAPQSRIKIVVTVAVILLAAADARPVALGKGTGTVSIQLPFLSITLTKCPATAATDISAQTAALLRSKASIKDPQGKLTSWSADTDACKWKGVKCEEGLVVKVDVEGFGLQGSMPVDWTAITTLQELDLSVNEFTGPIPSCYGNMADLTELELNQNKLSGPLPREMGQLSKLTELELQNNNLSGAIPAEWGNLKSLEKLSLYNNPGLSGCVPVALKAQGTEFEIASSAEEPEYIKDAAAAAVRTNTAITGFC